MEEIQSAAVSYARQQKARFLEELKTLVNIPSISTDPAAQDDVLRAAQWISERMKDLGMQKVEIFPTARHPVVYGELLEAGPDKPTVLIYGHYDVQPPEPLELWDSPAFEAAVRGENLYGRGASDMKGQVLITLNAIESLIRTSSLPVNVKFIIEGEEEIGSPNLPEFITSHKELLACNFALNPDTGMIGAEVPTITYSLRGLAYFELRVSGPDHDLHSGVYGGTVHNPAQALCELVAGMHDKNGRITLPGYYDSVRSISDEERQQLSQLPMDDDFYLKQTGAPQLFGEVGFTSVERAGARPTLEVNGLLSGFTGEGAKTVLPAKAMAKISMRLVPDQDPKEVYQQLLSYLKANAPDTIEWEVIQMTGGPASITDLNIPGVKALSQAMEATWGKKPLFRREGGSVPVVAQMHDILNIESVLTGFGLPDDNLHAPNEKIHLPTFYRGIEAITRFLCILGED
jgi:acetylornithine deacetylase/succinyl-diaminopimelate desuccinylase-like protein